ncbi:MAG: helix-turn-helix transcriptional regulator [Prevotella sp.]|nr:helix-turn-helix transcriptional regulator [Prevotella sp.]
MVIKNNIIDPRFPDCPIRNVIARLGDRWSILVLLTLEPKTSAMRYRDIQKSIPDISQKMLTRTLRSLEADGLVERIAYAEVPPRVEYSLTSRGRSLIPPLNSLIDWAMENLNGIISDRKKFTGE